MSARTSGRKSPYTVILVEIGAPVADMFIHGPGRGRRVAGGGGPSGPGGRGQNDTS